MQPEQPWDLYEINLKGHIDLEWVDWAHEVDVQLAYDDHHLPVTVLRAWLPDQPALHGILDILRDMNIRLVSVQCIEGLEKQQVYDDYGTNSARTAGNTLPSELAR